MDLSDGFWSRILWDQFSAAIEMLDNAIRACPGTLWAHAAPDGRPTPFWHIAYHTLFFLDKYLSGDPEAFSPPAPFDMALRKLEPGQAQVDRVYTKDELLQYLEQCERKCRMALRESVGERARQPGGLGWLPISRAELHVYNLRHVQHHAAQLNLLLRQAGGEPPDWVSAGSRPLDATPA